MAVRASGVDGVKVFQQLLRLLGAPIAEKVDGVGHVSEGRKATAPIIRAHFWIAASVVYETDSPTPEFCAKQPV